MKSKKKRENTYLSVDAQKKGVRLIRSRMHAKICIRCFSIGSVLAGRVRSKEAVVQLRHAHSVQERWSKIFSCHQRVLVDQSKNFRSRVNDVELPRVTKPD
jgi:DNA-directed RNA polymerase subunit N (RpoN/RPB10)